MELAVIAGLSLLGYRLAARGAAPRYTVDTHPLVRRDDEFPGTHEHTVDALLARDAREAGRHVDQAQRAITAMRYPDRGGFQPIDATPFVTNDARQTFDEPHARRRMETFTGTDSYAFRRKSERGALFQPDERGAGAAVGSGGAPRAEVDVVNVQNALLDRATFGSRFNNVGPTDRVLVGRGLGVGVDVPAAGGLHSTWRHLPVEDLNEHRINQLQSRTNHGARPTTERLDDLPNLTSQRRDLSYVPKPVGAARAAGVEAQRLLSEANAPRVVRSDAEVDRLGTAPAHRDSAGAYALPTVSHVRKDMLAPVSGEIPTSIMRGHTVYEGHALRPSDRCTDNPFVGGAFNSTGGTYVEHEHIMRDTDRETLNEYVGGAHYKGVYLSQGAPVRTTDREWATCDRQGSAFAATARAPHAPQGMVMRDTARGLYAPDPANAMGRATGAARSCAPPGTTLRELAVALPVAPGSRPGAAARIRRGAYRQGAKLLVAREPVGAIPSATSAHGMPQRVLLRDHSADGLPVAHGTLTSAAIPRWDPRATPRNKLPVANPRAPPGTCEGP